MDGNFSLKVKSHYVILDGLRGVAAIMVLFFHLLEAHATSHFDQIINHGYLAVDFFFILSGFVIGYAYDDRWKGMSLKAFFTRRLIRLQPMIVIGVLIGGVLFYFGTGENVGQTSIGMLLICVVAGCLLLPLPLSMDIRGWTEMYPVNGPQWSLFFEYIANILYALVFRRFSKGVLSICVFLAGCLTIHFLFNSAHGDVVGGWDLTVNGIYIGMTRLLYPFLAGLLLARLNLSIRIPQAFWVCTVMIVLLLAMPRFGSESTLWMNALYECVCILLLFPLIVILGSSQKTLNGGAADAVCALLGRISYPLYLVHYPFVYMYYKYAQSGEASVTQCFMLGGGIACVSLLLAWLCERFYDAPVRKWLQSKIGI